MVNDLIRQALYPYPRELAIVSKVAAGRDDIRQLREGIEENLRSLRVDQLAAVNLRLPGDGRVDARFDDQVAAMIRARDVASRHARYWPLRRASGCGPCGRCRPAGRYAANTGLMSM